MKTEVKFPHVQVKLIGEDSNSFSIMGRVREAMSEGGCSKEEIERYIELATSGNYDNLLQTTMATVSCDCEDCDECGDVPCTC